MKKEDIINIIEKIIENEEEGIILKKVFFINDLQISFNDKGKIHSNNQKPALSIKNKHINQKAYLKSNILHRDNFKPAILQDNEKLYFINGKKISKKKNKKLKKQSIIKNKLVQF
tara:strand:+ start:1816 stop:2160 length:345 start_codon:yes stop_codon:yes gene_type:complete